MTRMSTTLFLALSSIAAACGGDSASQTGTQTGTCLTDGQICSLALGVTTEDGVLKQFGTPSDTAAGMATGPYVSYVCLRISNSGVLLYSQAVALQFDANTLLTNIIVDRSGSDATPIPACVAKLKT